jgi:hyaluronoglucosaminidase
LRVPESPFALRGVIEGFYGTFYTFPERNDLIRFLGAQDFNVYVYGPKNDRQHRMRWWDPYPDEIMEDFGRTIQVAHDAGVRFYFTVSFGVPLSFATSEDFGVVTGKFQALYDRGCRAFGILLDDAPTGFAHDVNRKAFASAAAAHADFCNRALDWIGAQSEPCALLMAPTEYHGAPPFSDYLPELGRLLDPRIEIFYTGREICSPTLTAEDCRAFAGAVGRKPLIWDNYPVNDLQMRQQLHLGPLVGRDPALPTAVSGMVFNPMLQPEASKIPLLTIAEYLRDPAVYDPNLAWERALRTVASDRGYAAMRIFADNCLGSSIHPEEAPVTDSLAASALAAIRRGERAEESREVGSLSDYLDRIDEAIYYIRNRMPNTALRQNIIPWIESLDEKLWLGRRSITLLRHLQAGGDVHTMVSGLNESLEEVHTNPRSIGGHGLTELGEYVYNQVRDLQRDAPRTVADDRPAPETHDHGGAAFAADR